MIKSNITDQRNKHSAYVDVGNNHEEVPGLVVATRELKTYNLTFKKFLNPTYGENMNIDAGFTGTPVLLYDENTGAPTEWITSAITGTWVFNNATQAYNGTVSISNLSTNPGNINATMQLATVTPLNLTGYIAIAGWIRLTATPSDAIYIGGYSTGTLIGKLVDIRNHINTGSLNVWQKFIISIDDFNLTGETINQLRITKLSRYSTFYIDYIRIQESGGAINYIIEPELNSHLLVQGLRWFIATTYNSTLINSTVPLIPYDSFLGITLISGISALRTSNGTIFFTAIYKSLYDLLNSSSAKIVNSGFDGTDTWMLLETDFPTPIILKSEYQDSIIYTINDDMSGFSKFTMTAICKTEPHCTLDN